jgi:hypothetical protein
MLQPHREDPGILQQEVPAQSARDKARKEALQLWGLASGRAGLGAGEGGGARVDVGGLAPRLGCHSCRSTLCLVRSWISLGILDREVKQVLCGFRRMGHRTPSAT